MRVGPWGGGGGGGASRKQAEARFDKTAMEQAAARGRSMIRRPDLRFPAVELDLERQALRLCHRALLDVPRDRFDVVVPRPAPRSLRRHEGHAARDLGAAERKRKGSASDPPGGRDSHVDEGGLLEEDEAVVEEVEVARVGRHRALYAPNRRARVVLLHKGLEFARPVHLHRLAAIAIAGIRALRRRQPARFERVQHGGGVGGGRSPGCAGEELQQSADCLVIGAAHLRLDQVLVLEISAPASSDQRCPSKASCAHGSLSHLYFELKSAGRVTAMSASSSGSNTVTIALYLENQSWAR